MVARDRTSELRHPGAVRLVGSVWRLWPAGRAAVVVAKGGKSDNLIDWLRRFSGDSHERFVGSRP